MLASVSVGGRPVQVREAVSLQLGIRLVRLQILAHPLFLRTLSLSTFLSLTALEALLGVLAISVGSHIYMSCISRMLAVSSAGNSSVSVLQ